MASGQERDLQPLHPKRFTRRGQGRLSEARHHSLPTSRSCPRQSLNRLCIFSSISSSSSRRTSAPTTAIEQNFVHNVCEPGDAGVQQPGRSPLKPTHPSVGACMSGYWSPADLSCCSDFVYGKILLFNLCSDLRSPKMSLQYIWWSTSSSGIWSYVIVSLLYL